MPRAALRPLLALFLALPGAAWADGIYTYTQADGTVVYTNVKPKNAKAKKLAGTFNRAPQPTDAPSANTSNAASNFDEHIEAASQRYKIPAALVRAVMHAESNFDPR